MQKHILQKIESFLKTDASYLITGGFWLSSSKAVAMVVTLASSVVFANFLPEETYGVYRYIISLLALLALPTLKGVNTAVTTAVARGHDGSFLSGLQVKTRWSIIAACITAAVSAYYYYKGNYIFGHIFALSSILMPVLQISYLYVAVLNGKKAFKALSVHLAASRIFVAITLAVTVLLTSNLLLIFLVYFFSYILSQILSSIITWRQYITNDVIEQETTSYGKHLSLIQAVTVVANNIDKVLLFQFAGPAVLAGYYLALMPFKQLKNFVSTINTLALPKLSERSISVLRATLPTKLVKSFLVIIPIVFAYVLLAPTIFSVLFPNYVDFVLVSQLFVLTLLLAPTSVIQTAMTALKLKKQLYFVSTSTAVIRVVLLLTIVPIWGLSGAVSVVIISQLYTAICLVVLFWYTTQPSTVKSLGD